MSLSGMLSSVHSAIASQSGDIDRQITKLEHAKSRIESEQNACLGEIKKVEQPDLGKDWSGTRAGKFDDAREAARQAMTNIYEYDYDMYKSRIDGRINGLKIERGALNAASAIAHEASELMEKGEDFMEAAGDKLSELKGWLF
ncbi:uncharacterized protein DUF5082 [Scopulibacillus darangshiensis]|uniref:Uncharacterized protein DUF5082 n=1 Tax=Scopulibacillus darangshiensis TaxID=442528 RepID=A0A4R2P8E3_9BACL|nr:DUF5082 family protein [Scopulibacillus darangshiensis]TCP31223.1 uncharacterized protein DUF5082 [Scopulibacillus darangshiensis]